MRGFLSRVRMRGLPPAAVAEEPVAEAPHKVATFSGPDASRRYWARGDRPAAEERRDARGRVAALVHAHENGPRPQGGRPRGNPAFSEALFVELMRAKQYRRAFEQLSAECRSRWGSADAFAAAQGSAMRFLQGVNVKDVRYLPEWVDPRAGTSYRDVAELDVEYTLAGRDSSTVVSRVVHLVPDEGKWRSLCYPT